MKSRETLPQSNNVLGRRAALAASGAILSLLLSGCGDEQPQEHHTKEAVSVACTGTSVKEKTTSDGKFGYKVDASYIESGASFTSYSIDWGDHTTVDTANPPADTQDAMYHPYAKAGTYEIVVTENFKASDGGNVVTAQCGAETVHITEDQLKNASASVGNPYGGTKVPFYG